MRDDDSDDDMLFILETRGDLYEPEYTEEELFQRETERCRYVNKLLYKEMLTDQRANGTAAVSGTWSQHNFRIFLRHRCACT